MGPRFGTVLAVGLFTLLPAGTAGGAAGGHILIASDASHLEGLAGREVRRYVYLRTGHLLPIARGLNASGAQDGLRIIVTRAGRRIEEGSGGEAGTPPDHGYILRTLDRGGRRTLVILGADDLATLHGAYRFAEHLGVRFYLEGDTVPDERIPLELPTLDERRAPLFELRGIQPFHDFPEGPDWWDVDGYKAILAQVARLQMNFFGLHTYPEAAPGAEPTTWIGPAEEIGTGAAVKASYASSYQNTLRGDWGYRAKKTSDFACGAAMLFDRDDYGAGVMRGMCPVPQTPEAQNELFERTGILLRDGFTYAKSLGIQTCVGTETPLRVPKAVAERLKAGGRDPKDARVIQQLYEGMFQRIMQTYPLDYYWFWTPEGWTWHGTTDEQVSATLNDIKAAIAAADQVQAPFRLATCGWVLGPQSDRSLFDRMLPKSMAVSCINRQVGMSPVEPGFSAVEGRGKWAIPWLEDDPALTSLQLWAGRMRRDAADALDYGCNGLMGIHWRTRALGPNIGALASAAWDQTGWRRERPRVSGAVGGEVVTYHNPIADTDDDPLYQSVRYNLPGYRIYLPDGQYRVTLRFCEVHYAEAGKRVFDVKLRGQRAIEGLDVFARVGKDKALDFVFEDVTVKDGRLDIDFGYRVELPFIAAIEVVSDSAAVKINCGGPAYKDYAADPPAPGRDLPCADFYADWARQNFGSEAGQRIGAIFARMDGKMPRPTDWIEGPGGVRADPRPWEQIRAEYAFVDELAECAPVVRGAGAQARFAYWLETLKYMRAVARMKCIWGAYDRAMADVRAKTDTAARKARAIEAALPLRRQKIEALREVYHHLLATVSTTGELGTVANWDQHNLPDVLGKPGAELEQILGEPLAADLQMPRQYEGPPRVIVPTVRPHLASGEDLRLKVILLGGEAPRSAALRWRRLGGGEFASIPLAHVARGVYSVTVRASATAGEDFEYYVQAQWGGREPLRFPPTAPDICQSVIVTP